jgi:hypothetical protein
VEKIKGIKGGCENGTTHGTARERERKKECGEGMKAK